MSKPKEQGNILKRGKVEKNLRTKGNRIKGIKTVLPKNETLKKPQPSSNFLILNSKKFKKDSVKLKVKKVFIATFYEYAEITKVNGMFYLREFVTSGWVRVLWSCIMIGLLSFSATLIYLLYGRYVTSPTRVTIASAMPINSIPFPGLTICHPQNIMEYKSREFVKKA